METVYGDLIELLTLIFKFQSIKKIPKIKERDKVKNRDMHQKMRAHPSQWVSAETSRGCDRFHTNDP